MTYYEVHHKSFKNIADARAYAVKLLDIGSEYARHNMDATSLVVLAYQGNMPYVYGRVSISPLLVHYEPIFYWHQVKYKGEIGKAMPKRKLARNGKLM